MHGRERVAKQFLRFLETFGIRLAPMAVNGEPGLVAFRGDALVAVIAFETRGGLVTKIHGMGNPQKLAYVASLLGTNAAGAS